LWPSYKILHAMYVGFKIHDKYHVLQFVNIEHMGRTLRDKKSRTSLVTDVNGSVHLRVQSAYNFLNSNYETDVESGVDSQHRDSEDIDDVEDDLDQNALTDDENAGYVH